MTTKFTTDHEWINIEDHDAAVVGITLHAQDALGDVVYVSLPVVGAEVAASATCAEVESTKSVSDIYAPVAGTVVEVNPDLSDAPQRLNEDPYGEGWLIRIRLSNPSEVDALLDVGAYKQLLADQ